MKLNRPYAGVTFLCSLITGNYLVSSDLIRLQRLHSFSNEFMEVTFLPQHQREVGDDPASMGFPDDGNGRYMKERSYGDWYYFNVAKRVHANDHEHLVTILPLSLINGIVYPIPTIGMLLTYFLGRQLYTVGYYEKEGTLSKKRMLGSALIQLVHIGSIGLAFRLGYRLSKGKLSLKL